MAGPGRRLAPLLLTLLPAEVPAVACPAGSEVRYFHGASGRNFIDVGNPPIGRVQCNWPEDDLPSTCPFHLRMDKGGTNTENMLFEEAFAGNWPCDGANHGGGGTHSYCWFTSTVKSGPDAGGRYALEDGSVGVPAHMVFSGREGREGACNGNVYGHECSNTDVAWTCPPGYSFRADAVPGPRGCQQDFCDEAAFAGGCCVPTCARGYGGSVGNCPRGTFGGSYTKTCAESTCTEGDEASCCQETATCAPGASVEVFGLQSNGDFINIGNPVTGRVHCLWENEPSPPSTCPFYPRLDDGGFSVSEMVFAETSSKSVNCAHSGGVGARHCWYPATIKHGPTQLDMYDTNEGEVDVPWYKVYTIGPAGWAACSQGGLDCGTQAYACADAAFGSIAKDGVALGPGKCQAKFCDFKTFAAGCCEHGGPGAAATATTTTINIAEENVFQ